MIRSVMWLALTMGLALAVILGMPTASGPALADEAVDRAEARLTFEEPQASGTSISVSVLVTTGDGEPIARQPVDFFVTPDFLGERLMPLQTALTNAQGRATVTYAPTWEGAHRITARFGGDEAREPGEATVVMIVSGLSSTYADEGASLSAVSRWASPGAVAIAIAVWLVLAWVLARVAWGIWQAGRRGEERVPALPSERAIERLPGSTYR